MSSLALIVAAVAGYLAGSVPFGLLLTKAAGLGDIRKIGSGNIGATNVLRTGNKGLALATLILDGGKGAVAVIVAGAFDPLLGLVAGGAAMLGHAFPVWLGFRGGKGVATAAGTMLAAAPWLGLVAVALWLATAFLFRISSLAALAATVATALLAVVLALAAPGTLGATGPVAILTVGLAILVVVRHHANIGRLLRGEEPRIGRKAAG
jgi:glycerol-3-phosphate acyltransferase PlsY